MNEWIELAMWFGKLRNRTITEANFQEQSSFLDLILVNINRNAIKMATIWAKDEEGEKCEFVALTFAIN